MSLRRWFESKLARAGRAYQNPDWLHGNGAPPPPGGRFVDRPEWAGAEGETFESLLRRTMEPAVGEIVREEVARRHAELFWGGYLAIVGSRYRLEQRFRRVGLAWLLRLYYAVMEQFRSKTP